LSLSRDDDQLVAYRLPKDAENVLTVVFVHQHAEETGDDRWYDFDDSNVSPISEDKIKTLRHIFFSTKELQIADNDIRFGSIFIKGGLTTNSKGRMTFLQKSCR